MFAEFPALCSVLPGPERRKKKNRARKQQQQAAAATVAAGGKPEEIVEESINPRFDELMKLVRRYHQICGVNLLGEPSHRSSRASSGR